jgi:hypothetical protein
MISILDTASTYMHLVTMPNNTLPTMVNALLEGSQTKYLFYGTTNTVPK